MPTNIPGVTASFIPKLVFEFSEELSLTFKEKPAVSISYDSDTGLKTDRKSGADNRSITGSINCTAFFGLKFEFGLNILSDDILNASASVKAGLEASTTPFSYEVTEGETNAVVLGVTNDAKTKHVCSSCFEIQLKFVLNGEVGLKALKVFKTSVKLLSISFDLGKAYYSDSLGFGLGECPNKNYLVTFTFSTPNSYSTPTLKIDNVTVPPNGSEYKCFCANGTHSFTVASTYYTLDQDGNRVYHEYDSSGTFTVYRETKNIHYSISESRIISETEEDVPLEETPVIEAEEGFDSDIVPFDGTNQDIDYSVQLGDDIYAIVFKDGYAFVYGSGEMYDFQYSPLSTATEVDFEDADESAPIANIGAMLFDKCADLQTVTLSEHIEKIGNGAFYQCGSLSEIMLPNSVTEIGEYAFADCTGLTYNIIPGSVTDIGECAFSGCTGLQNIAIPVGVVNIHSRAFSGCTGAAQLSIPSTVRLIDGGAFENCTGLTSVTVPGNVQEVCTGAFCCCSNLKTAVLEEGIETIGYNIFNGCTALEELTLPYAGISAETDVGGYDWDNQVDSLFNYTYTDYHCSISDDYQLRKITVTGGERVSHYAFYGMDMVEEIILPESIQIIGTDAFGNCTGLTALTIPDSVSEICSCAFQGCTGLTAIDIPEGVALIDDGAFAGCTGAKSLSISSTVTEIRDGAFSGCTGLTSVTVPGTVKALGAAFGGCSNLKTAVLEEGIETIDAGIFTGCTALEELTLPFASTKREYTMAEIPDYSDFEVSQISDLFVISSEYWNQCYLDCKITDDYSIRKITVTGGDCIPQYAFNGMDMLEEIVLPEGLKVIGQSAFYGCAGLSDITIPSTVTYLGEGAFGSCTGLTHLTLPDSLEEICSGAFRWCSGLTKLVIPDSVYAVGYNQFRQPMEEITLPFASTCREYAEITDEHPYGIGDSRLNYKVTDIIEYNSGSSATSPSNYRIGKITVTGGDCVPPYAFYGLDKLEKVVLMESIRRIASNAFFRALSEVTIMNPDCEIGWIPYETTICGWLGSTAQAYAEENGNPFIPLDPPVIETQPNGIRAAIGSTAKFKVAAAGAELSYQWQYNSGDGWKNSNGTGAKTDTLSISVTAARNGWKYRCIITDRLGRSCTSGVATLKVKTTVTAQPESVSAPTGEAAEFTVAASGAGLTYQWQYNKGDGWKNSGATGSKTTALTINSKTTYNGWQYRCVITDANGVQTVSGTAKLTVRTVITAQPESVSAPTGEAAKFTVAASGAGLTYQWQYNKGDGWKISNGSGSKTATLSINTAATYNGWQYRCVITDANGAQTVSGTAKLTVKTVIVTQPNGYQAALNEAAKFTVSATGAGLKYQWQYNAGDGWKTSGATGSKTAELTIYGKTTYNGWKFRCVITDANGATATSSVATLKIKTTITAQPANVSAAIGDTANFTVKANGLELSYQWQYNAGAGWKNSGAAGAATATLSISAKTAYNGYQYRCVITDGNGNKTISAAAALTIKAKITAQPASITAATGTAAVFTVKATGMELSYQWQYNSGTGWKTSNGTGAKTAALTINAKASYNGWQYRCVVTDANGNKVISSAATLTVE